jgi:hypothetical protein
MHAGFPHPAKKSQPKLDAPLRRRKVTVSEHDAEAILAEPRSVKKQILISLITKQAEQETS